MISLSRFRPPSRSSPRRSRYVPCPPPILIAGSLLPQLSSTFYFFPFIEWDPLDIRQKRALSDPAEDVFDRLKRARIVMKAPSDTAKSAVYEQLQQEPSEKILDDRPEPDADIPPIPLLYEGFGHFLDIMDGRDDVPGLADVDVRELWKAVDDWILQ